MIKIIENKNTIKLQRGNKIIERSILDYETNKAVYNFRGFKPVKDVVKETKVEQPKKKKVVRKKKDVQVDLETDKKELEVAVQKDME
jgi:hypothetical protein